MSFFETLGDRMKSYEQREAGRSIMVGLPVLARLDGRAFHSYTRGLAKPYDPRLSELMVDTLKYLVDKFHPLVGYVQSDEITLLWAGDYTDDGVSKVMFNGKYQKLTSVLAATASAYFATEAVNRIPEKANMLPTFDCRVWQVPNKSEAANTFYWREMDATKNAISMAAHAHFSDKELHGKNGAEKQEMLFSSHGINFNDYPAFFKRGVYVRREVIDIVVNEDHYENELAHIPRNFRPEIGDKITRSAINAMDWPKCSSLANYVELLFNEEKNPRPKEGTV